MRLKPLKFNEVRRKLENAGFSIVSQKGSHIKFAREFKGEVRTAIVPKHKEIHVGTLKSILRQAGLSWEKFERL
jgi:predicted RNA binding protein YcfA (HicA-like mRNA interferase family)